jgi:hypothetical protein
METPPYPPAPYQPPQPPTAQYPLTFRVDYPEKLDRLTTGLRFLWIIPIGIISALLTSGAYTFGRGTGAWSVSVSTAGLLFLPVLLMILFKKKYPRWWFDWNLNLSRFTARVSAYGALLRDEYPSTDDEQAVHLDFSYPDATLLSRGLPIVKWFLAIPHIIILLFLWIAAFVCIVIGWFAIVFTGVYPRSLFDFVVGVMRWSYRVSAYAELMITDQYPPFSLHE